MCDLEIISLFASSENLYFVVDVIMKNKQCDTWLWGTACQYFNVIFFKKNLMPKQFIKYCCQIYVAGGICLPLPPHLEAQLPPLASQLPEKKWRKNGQKYIFLLDAPTKKGKKSGVTIGCKYMYLFEKTILIKLTSV